ncbi:MAG: bifunctional UDP-3-O-[3-hydroxymyristoyl] N-acetylglucosamine deacetylase/3-hydroxyacyl-ACP dehydratase [Bacteroidales bacterium]|nr:bifunctional UDP-3-O-[3-hydroxymyristoyl] N-acetylglucosamine deacetylase/3-hydroxyacyl-ACP dehydratase [Bacteroidales bacterium]
MTEKQRTIKSDITLNGAGLHTGDNVTLTFKPAPENNGIKFRRIDLPGQPLINADIDNVVDTSRGTSIEQNGVKIKTVEHTLAAVAGLSIDNLIIELNCSETPILDGSSREYVSVLKKAGIIEQNADREYFELDSNIHYYDAEKKAEMIAIPSDKYQVSVMIDYENTVLGTQNAKLNSIEDFENEIAKSRTFVFLHDLEQLLNNNLIKGGDLSNAIVFVNNVVSESELSRLAHIFNKPEVKVLNEGILNNIELHYPNEPARHKVLDIIGDLSLIGKPIKGHIIATKPGHKSNIQFAKLIKQYMKKKITERSVPVYDINKAPLYNINDIKKILRHRNPMLLIDKILEMSDKHVIGLKNVTMNESFFVGHFPDEPLMPAVLQVEAMAQAGGIFVLNTVPDPENYHTYFLKIDNARFRQKVIPGDTLIFRLELITPIKRGITHMKGIAYVGNRVVMEAELMAQIIKK